jgi:hypothetical protein
VPIKTVVAAAVVMTMTTTATGSIKAVAAATKMAVRLARLPQKVLPHQLRSSSSSSSSNRTAQELG